MAKEFNTEGSCFASDHYMADVSGKFAATQELVEKGKYFTVNRPRQYGKTTTLQHLADTFAQNQDYFVFSRSFEGVGDSPFDNEGVFVKRFMNWLADDVERRDAELAAWINQEASSLNELKDLSKAITKMVEKTGKKVVLIIDEVDKSSNNQLFVSFLGMLRDKYLVRHKEPTFHSVVLAGVHDVKSLKLKYRKPGEEAKLNSPWNIAADFNVDMNLQPHEVKPMLDEYAADKGVAMDTQHIADLLFHYTAGQPFLTSRLCKIFDERLLPKKKEKTWTPDDIETAVQALLTEKNTHFDDFFKNLENNQDLYRLVFRVVIDGEQFDYSADDPIVSLGTIYGVFPEASPITIHNRIYTERITNYLTSKWNTSATMRDSENLGRHNTRSQFLLPGNKLDVAKLLLKFQEFQREEYSKKDRDFLERQGRLLFFAFLKPILNGHGYMFKEPQISEEKRLDAVITFHEHKYVIELKIWRGQKAHDAGTLQLADYLERQGLDAGYLLIFDHAGVKEWKKDRIRKKGKQIFAVWV